MKNFFLKPIIAFLIVGLVCFTPNPALATVFGETTVGTLDSNGTLTLWNVNTTYTAPGSGTQQITELSAYTTYVSGSPTMRVGIYSADRATKICEGTAAVSVSGGPSWQGHLVATDITPNPCNVTGGTNYTLSFTINGVGRSIYYNSGSDGDWEYVATDNTAGMPASLPAGTSTALRWMVRADATAAAGAAARRRAVVF